MPEKLHQISEVFLKNCTNASKRAWEKSYKIFLSVI